MKGKPLLKLATLLAAAVLAPLAASAEGTCPATVRAPVAIHACPYTIMTSGRYVLAQDLTCFDDAITITADNVRLDLGGHTLSGIGSNTGVQVAGTPGNPTIDNLRISHGTFTSFGNGVRIADALEEP